MRHAKLSVIVAAAAALILGGCSTYSPSTAAMDEAAEMHPVAAPDAPRLVAGDPLGGTMVNENPRLLARVRARQADDTGLAGAETINPRN